VVAIYSQKFFSHSSVKYGALLQYRPPPDAGGGMAILS
jgi:hypothetical protein